MDITIESVLYMYTKREWTLVFPIKHNFWTFSKKLPKTMFFRSCDLYLTLFLHFSQKCARLYRPFLSWSVLYEILCSWNFFGRTPKLWSRGSPGSWIKFLQIPFERERMPKKEENPVIEGQNRFGNSKIQNFDNTNNMSDLYAKILLLYQKSFRQKFCSYIGTLLASKKKEEEKNCSHQNAQHFFYFVPRLVLCPEFQKQKSATTRSETY